MTQNQTERVKEALSWVKDAFATFVTQAQVEEPGYPGDRVVNEICEDFYKWELAWSQKVTVNPLVFNNHRRIR